MAALMCRSALRGIGEGLSEHFGAKGLFGARCKPDRLDGPLGCRHRLCFRDLPGGNHGRVNPIAQHGPHGRAVVIFSRRHVAGEPVK